MELIGKVLGGRYEILEQIGVGGMAYVYKAKCQLLNRYVAVKVLKPEYANDETFVKRFKAEAQSAAALTHPNIVSVYDVGQDGDINYIVMELLESKTLKDYIEENGALSNELTLKIAAQIASALEVAHKSHIIHRDIKPQNIVLNKNLVAKVTDFGIAKIATATGATITSFGTTMGSVHYFSPEHAKGGYTDEKSDIYSLGVVMYEMATGKLPFDAESAVSVALKHIQEEPVPPMQINQNVSVALNQIILKAMSKSTAKRYQSASSLLVDIAQGLDKPNSLILKQPVSVEPGATQMLSTIEAEQGSVPNIRTRQARKMTVVNSNSRNKETEENIEYDDDDDDENYKTPLTDAQRKKRKKKIIIISCAVTAIILIFGTFIGVKIYKNVKANNAANAEYEVPNLIGRVFSEVASEYEKQGIQIIQDKSEYDKTIPEGSIVSQDIEKGTKTKNKKILVVVSKGVKSVDVPDVVGKDIKVAKYELEDTLGFVIELEEVINEKVKAGIITAQSPKGDKAPYGSTIKITVSKGDGKATVLMPSVLGKSEADAKKIIEAAGLTVKIKYGEDSSKSNTIVIAQNYPQNQELKAGDLVEITINKLLITKAISLNLLELQGGTPLNVPTIQVKVTASIDSGATNTVFDKSFDPKQANASFTINGYKTAALKIYINGNLTKDYTINF
ncbi:MAG: Stk1 family PASTA domain-containing Ser/Thr kinase [Clostridia bacterium]